MLMLNRRAGESIIIGEGEDQVIIRFIKSQGNVGTIGIIAPQSVKVDREEIRMNPELSRRMQERRHVRKEIKTLEQHLMTEEENESRED